MQTFVETGLKPEILQALESIGFEKPTPIQAKAIPHLINSDKDLLAYAQTGTGKTAAFSLPLIHGIDEKSDDINAIILCPTRELCLQIERDIQTFIKYIPDLKAMAVYGGESIDRQIKGLRSKPNIIVGTPGRVCDLIRRKKLKLGNINYVVLDEADEMLTMGFKDELDQILSACPSERQTLCFSATMPRELLRIANEYMDSPDEITAGQRNVSAENVKHVYLVADRSDKYEVLKRVADINPNIYAIVFCRTRMGTKEVADRLMADKYAADALHGDLSQAQRDYVMNKFRKKQIQILVATDVAARGIDVNDLTHVINYELPDQLEAYIHRSGRTGRAGKEGMAVSLITRRDLSRISQLERKIGKKISMKKIPTGQEICQRQLFSLVDKFVATDVNDDINEYLPMIEEKMEALSKEELIKKFVSSEFNRFLSYYKNSQDLNSKDRSKKTRGGKYSRFHINVGKKQGLDPKDIIGILNDTRSLRNIEVGQIDIMNNFSFFEVPNDREQDVIPALDGARYKSQQIEIELAKPKPSSSSSSSSNYDRPRKARFNKSKSGGGSGGSSRGRGRFSKGGSSAKSSGKSRSSRFSY
jgi:ATP-dependent RNA helicase DeaD